MKPYENLTPEATGLLAGSEGRALWFHLLIEGAEKMGVDVDALCDYAIFRNGKEVMSNKTATNALEASLLFAGTDSSAQMFGVERVVSEPDHAVVYFHRCPLYYAWEKYGLPRERLDQLCLLACKGDYGRASNFPVSLTFHKRLGAGDDYCELDFVTTKD